MRIILLGLFNPEFFNLGRSGEGKSFNRPLTKREELYTINHSQTDHKGLVKKELV